MKLAAPATYNNLADHLDSVAGEKLRACGLRDEVITSVPGLIFYHAQANSEELNLYTQLFPGKHFKNKKNGACSPELVFAYSPKYGVRRTFRDDGKSPKYLATRGFTQHYVLSTVGDDPFAWKPSPKDIYIITEGQIKALKLWQELRGDPRRFVIVGITGVTNFYGADPRIPVKDKDVYLAFDADKDENKNVRREELKLYAYLRNNCARNIASLVWDGNVGKGIDDFLAVQDRPLEALTTIIDEAVNPLSLYEESDLRLISESLMAAEKHTRLSKYVLEDFVVEFKELFGAKLGASRQLLQRKHQEIKERLVQAQLMERQDYVQNLFKLSYDMAFPRGYTIEEGKLCADKTLSELFIIDHYIQGESDSAYSLKFASGASLVLPGDALADTRKLATLFNRHRQALDSFRAKLLSGYISDFWQLNGRNIPVKPYYDNTGWIDDSRFRLPALCPDAVFPAELSESFCVGGDASAQKNFLKQLVQSEANVGALLILGLVSPLISRLKLPRFVVNVFGETGSGKTATLDVLASFMGDHSKIVRSADSTKVGRELLFVFNNDLPVLIDELKTGGQDGRAIARSLLSLIFNFVGGKQRLRGNVELKMRKSKDFHGILFTTANRSLETILSYADTDTDGAHRRVLDIPVQGLWSDESTGAFARRYGKIQKHYGHIMPLWIQYLADGALERISAAYKAEGHTFDSVNINSRGVEKLLKLAVTIIPDVLDLLGFDDADCRTELELLYSELFWAMGERQAEIVNRNTIGLVGRFIDDFADFVSEERDKCILTAKDQPQRKTFILRERLTDYDECGEEISSGDENHYFLTTAGLKTFCQNYQFEQRLLATSLIEAGILADKRASKRYAGAVIKAWKILIPEE